MDLPGPTIKRGRGRPRKGEEKKLPAPVEKKKVRRPRNTVPLDQLGQVCFWIYRRMITYAKAKVKHGEEPSRNEMDVVTRIVNLQPGLLKMKAFLRWGDKDPEDTIPSETGTDTSVPEFSEDVNHPPVEESREDLLAAATLIHQSDNLSE